MLGDVPPKSEKSKLRAVIIILCWCKGVTTKSKKMVVPVILLLRQHHTQPFLGGVFQDPYHLPCLMSRCTRPILTSSPAHGRGAS